jgi:dTDP-4-dehydrorhamnose reductase
VPIIQLCTYYVFDGKKTSAYVEEDMVATSCVYDASKLVGERAVVSIALSSGASTKLNCHLGAIRLEFSWNA